MKPELKIFDEIFKGNLKKKIEFGGFDLTAGTPALTSF